MNTQIKNFLTIAVLTGTVFITACAAKDKTTNNINGLTASGDPVSGNAVSHGVVSGSTVNKEVASGTTISGSTIITEKPSQDVSSKKRTKKLLAEIKKQRCANDYNIYEGDKMDTIYQYSLTGEIERSYDVGAFSVPEVVSVDNDSILYFCYFEDGNYVFFYAPLSGKKGNRRIETSKIIRLDCGSDYENFIAKRKNIIYYVKNSKIYSLNIKTNKSHSLNMNGVSIGEYDGFMQDYTGNTCIQNENAYFVSKDKYLYQFSLKNCKITKISRKTIDDLYNISAVTIDKNNVYYFRGHNLDYSISDDLIKVSLETGEKSVFISGTVIEELVDQYSPLDYEKPFYYSITVAVIHKGRIYFDVDVSPDNYNVDWHILFSCPADDSSNITYEKAFTECSEIKPYLSEDDDEYIQKKLNGTFVHAIDTHRFVLEAYDGDHIWDDKNETFTGEKYYVLYDIETKQAKRFEYESLEYCLAIASGYTEFEEDEPGA